ncbi:hypothetical protein PGT21_017648 [Puccinia graminis f. sp. tritici]|uniref:Uncharacterized protein n=1 Tax=Puccinia graminis f. sp. tritici TaxID=56615 RepID=A0A5B0MKH7_PUCGR|nr:hypothetical protein PGT21_017648 [Puccinia graminis f. sp. tritici]KAA1126918.1 hypothetical protein PGTUg99_031695 [Puccinia graminis f. sp. tritici]
MFEDEQINFWSNKSIGDTHELDKIQVYEIKWDEWSNLDINAAPYQFQPEQVLTSKAIPENCISHFFPETNSTQQSEPDFDLKNYSTKDYHHWSSTLSADEFEHLCVMGPNTRTESFRQYAITNHNQPTQTLTQPSSSTHEHLEHPFSTPNCFQENSNYHHHQPDDISSNNFDQQQLASPDDESRSTFYNHSDSYSSHLNDFYNGGLDDGGFENDDGFTYY